MLKDDDVMRAIYYVNPLSAVRGVNYDQYIRCGNRLLKESEDFRGSPAHKKFLQNINVQRKPFKKFDIV